MFEKILFPTDFSEPAKTELNCIASIPGTREIILLHVVRQYAIPMGAEMIESLEAQASEVYLLEAKAFIKTLIPDIKVTLEERISTDITGAILETADERRAGLIVIHSNIKSVISGVLLKCVSSKVLCRISKTNVLIMPNKLVENLSGTTFEQFCPLIFSRVLCPTNFSEFSQKTTTLAGKVKGVGEIILLHVIEKSENNRGPEVAKKTAESRINTLRDQLIAEGINARSLVVTGKPEVEIPRVAQDEDVSLIWMRSAAQGCLHDFFFGSMVHDVVMNTTRPVIVFRSYQ